LLFPNRQKRLNVNEKNRKRLKKKEERSKRSQKKVKRNKPKVNSKRVTKLPLRK
jgi:hypothetical protein